MSGIARVVLGCAVLLTGAIDCHAQKLNPKAKLVEPERGERRFVAPATIPLEGEAQAAAGRSIVRVEFFVETTLIGEASSAPYAINWADVPVGEYRLRIRATDSQGATDWSPFVRVRVLENRDPRVRLIEPGQDAQFSSPASILLRAQARDRDHNLARVEFYVDGALVGTSTAEPYSLSWRPVPGGAHVLLAKAIDAMGATDESRPVRISVTGNNPPAVNLTSPANGTVFSAPGSITVEANATDADGDLARVDFYAGQSLIGTANAPPYMITWANTVAGTYTITAQATDGLGLSTRSAAVSITVNAPPTVALTSPASGTVVQAPGNITLDANAGDSDGAVAKVDFYQGTTLIATDTSSPYSFSLGGLPAGTHSFTAVAADDRGATTTSAAVTVIVNAGPTVSLTSPASGTVVQSPGGVLLHAEAADNDGKVTKVDFYQGPTLIGTVTTAPYAFPVANLTAGIYTFTAVAADDSGGVTTSSATTLIVNAAPVASLTSPQQNAVFIAPANIPISADVVDSDGAVASVEFYFGTTLITTRTTPPYSIVWTGVPQGTYSLSARAVDNNGGTVTSTPVNVTVNSGVAKLYFIHVDHLNTPRLIADENQQTVWRWDQQEPFGNNPVDGNPSGLGEFDLPLRMAGQYFDNETGEYWNWFRSYSTSTGRYGQADPLGIVSSWPSFPLMGLNQTYAYANSNPLRYTDPTGLAPWPGYNWCGPGDNGLPPVNCVDQVCKDHDQCYDQCNVRAGNRWLPWNIASKCSATCDYKFSIQHKACKDEEFCRIPRPPLPPLPLGA